MAKYDFLGRIEAVWNKLGGESGVDRFLRGELIVSEAELPFYLKDELTIQIPALARPTLAELQAVYPWIKKIERDTSPTEAVTMKLATILRSNEERVSGEEYERRIQPKLSLLLGFQQAKWLVEHQDEFPEFMALLGKAYIDFSGLIVVREDGGRFIPYLNQFDERWYLDWRWVGHDFGRRGRIAISSAAFHKAA